MTPEQRVHAFEAVDNFRDYGGYSGAHGRIAPGRLFRSAHHGQATDADLERMAAFGIATLVDLRRRGERERDPGRRHRGFAAEVIDNDLGDEGTAPHLQFLAAGELDDDRVQAFMITEYERLPFEERHLDLYGRYFRALAEREGAVLIHCAAGKDRTGLLAALTHHVAGVHDDDAMEDYLLTNTASRIPERAPEFAELLRQTYGRDFALASVERFMGVEPVYLETARRVIIERYGSVDAYLEQALGVDAAMQERVRERLIA